MTPEQEAFLLIENDVDDVILIRRSFLELKMLNPLQVVSSGDEAIAYLSGDGRYSDRSEFPIPKTVFLELNMPVISGFDILRWIRRQPELKDIRIIALTDPNRIQEVSLAYELGASSFLVKPMDFSDIGRITKALQGYWTWSAGSREFQGPIEFPADEDSRGHPNAMAEIRGSQKPLDSLAAQPAFLAPVDSATTDSGGSIT